MLKALVILASLISSNDRDTLNYKPKHLMQTEELSCGAGGRLLKEKVKVSISPRTVFVNKVEWDFLGQGDEGWEAEYRTRPESFMSMKLVFTVHDAYLTLEGIDSKRRPCKDKVYLKRDRKVK